jgi:hypothetical protein
MSERKVLNKYFPPDFDPSKIPRMKKPKDRQEQIRLMAPFSMRCNTCGEYIYAGKKFNGRKETVQGEVYYGIKIFRFYIKCPVCSSEITFKTDPKNADYTVEHGVSRNFEPWREGRKEDGEDANADPLAHMIEEEGLQGSDDDDEDPMKALERRQNEAKREMEVMDALQDIRTRNARLDRVDADAVLQRVAEKGKERMLEEEQKAAIEDEELVKRYFGRDLAARPASASADHIETPARSSNDSPHTSEDIDAASAGPAVKRARRRSSVDTLDDEREPDVASLLSEGARGHLLAAGSTAFGSKQTPASASGLSKLPNNFSSGAAKRKKGSSAFGIVRKKA